MRWTDWLQLLNVAEHLSGRLNMSSSPHSAITLSDCVFLVTVLLRPSGTEDVVRVYAEADTQVSWCLEIHCYWFMPQSYHFSPSCYHCRMQQIHWLLRSVRKCMNWLLVWVTFLVSDHVDSITSNIFKLFQNNGHVCNWGEPERAHIDHDNGPRARNNTMSAFVAPWFPRSVYALKYSAYSSSLYWRAHVRDLQLHVDWTAKND